MPPKKGSDKSRKEAPPLEDRAEKKARSDTAEVDGSATEAAKAMDDAAEGCSNAGGLTKGHMVSSFHNWKKSGHPEYLEYYKAASKDEKNNIFARYLKDKKCNFMFAGRQESTAGTEVQKGVVADWLTVFEIADLEKIPSNHAQFDQLCQAFVTGCDERPHENENLAKVGLKQYRYCKRLAARVIESKKDEHVTSVSGTLSAGQHKNLSDQLESTGAASSSGDVAEQAIVTTTASLELELKNQIKCFKSAERVFGQLKADGAKTVALYKLALVEEPLLANTFKQVEETVADFTKTYDNLIDQSAAMDAFDLSDVTAVLVAKNNKDLIAQLDKARDNMKAMLRDSKRWLPSRSATAQTQSDKPENA